MGITERLRQLLGRDPDPKEVQEEMVQDKKDSGRVRSISRGGGTMDSVKSRKSENTGNSISSRPRGSPMHMNTHVSTSMGVVGHASGIYLPEDEL